MHLSILFHLHCSHGVARAICHSANISPYCSLTHAARLMYTLTLVFYWFVYRKISSTLTTRFLFVWSSWPRLLGWNTVVCWRPWVLILTAGPSTSRPKDRWKSHPKKRHLSTHPSSTLAYWIEEGTKELCKNSWWGLCSCNLDYWDCWQCLGSWAGDEWVEVRKRNSLLEYS